MRQLTLATASFDKHGKVTRRAAFLAEMERVVPCTVIGPILPQARERPPACWAGAHAAAALSAAVVQPV